MKGAKRRILTEKSELIACFVYCFLSLLTNFHLLSILMNSHWKKVAFLTNLRRLSAWVGILVLLLLMSGCTSRPFLTKDNSYSIVKVSPEGKTQKTPIQLTWNSNAAVLQKLLLEASFVLGDLHTHLNPDKVSSEGELAEKTPLTSEATSQEIKDNTQKQEVPKSQVQVSEVPSQAITNPVAETVLLEANFPQAKQFNLLIDDEQYTLDISSIQIEVEGKNPGRVILNQVLVLQGIPNSNLQSSFKEFIEMLKKSKEK